MILLCDITATSTLITITVSSPDPQFATNRRECSRYDRTIQNAAYRVAAALASAYGREGLDDVIDAGSASQGIIRIELVGCRDRDDVAAAIEDVMEACAGCHLQPKQ